MPLLDSRSDPIYLRFPLRIASSTWSENVPFGMYLIDVLRPRVVVELGVEYGVSYCAFCQAVQALGLNTQCYAIDTWQGDSQTGFYDGGKVLADLKRHHDPLYGSFSRLVQSTFDEAVDSFRDGTIDLLHIDGFHTYAAAKHDFETWRPKLSERGVVLFHDIKVHEGDFGVWKLWEELKPKFAHFELTHGYGLGLLSLDRLHPERLKELLDSTPEELARIESHFCQLGKPIREIQERLDALGAQVAADEHAIQELKSELAAIHGSKFWKLAMLYRSVVARFRG